MSRDASTTLVGNATSPLPGSTSGVSIVTCPSKEALAWEMAVISLVGSDRGFNWLGSLVPSDASKSARVRGVKPNIP